MKIVNCTPHPITVLLNDTEIVYPTSGSIPRVSSTEETVGSVNGIPMVKTTYGEVEGLPGQEEGTLVIVSAMVLQASNRTDLIAPNTGATAVRNDKGHIIAVTSFISK